MEKIITSKVRKNLNEKTARFILERSDKLASGTLEQLRKTTNRTYSMMGFLLTVFVALTAYVFSSPSPWRLAISLTLWIGVGSALFILFNKVLWVHKFKYIGNDPRKMISEENIGMLSEKHGKDELNEIYTLYSILDTIRINQETIDENEKALNDRCELMERAMTIIKVAVILAIIDTIAFAVTSSITTWW